MVKNYWICCCENCTHMYGSASVRHEHLFLLCHGSSNFLWLKIKISFINGIINVFSSKFALFSFFRELTPFSCQYQENGKLNLMQSYVRIYFETHQAVFGLKITFNGISYGLGTHLTGNIHSDMSFSLLPSTWVLFSFFPQWSALYSFKLKGSFSYFHSPPI